MTLLKQRETPAHHGVTHMSGGPDPIPGLSVGVVTATGTLTDHAVIVGNGGSDISALGSLGTSGQVLTSNGASADPSFQTPSAASGLIGYTQYRPGSDTPLTTTSATLADVDATNLAVSFTVPSTGNVLVRLTAYANSGGAGLDYWWSLREGSTDISGAGGAVSATTANFTVSVAFVITGLTPSASKTWKWSHARSTSGTGRMFAGPGGTFTPPAVMEVWSAP